jgi:hypothetical protein
VIVLDLTDPAHPVDVVEKPAPYTVRALAVPSPGRVVAACGLGGVLQWQID